MTRERRNTVSGSGAATAPGGYANVGIHLGDVNLLTGVPVRTRYRETVPLVLIHADAVEHWWGTQASFPSASPA